MHFCNKCGNMYYISIINNGENENEQQNKLLYYCKKCGNTDSLISESNVIVSKTQIKKKSQKYNHMINKYTKYDPTLPKANNIDCPNITCPSNDKERGVEKNIMYMRYDNDNMKYIFICGVCDKNFQFTDL